MTSTQHTFHIGITADGSCDVGTPVRRFLISIDGRDCVGWYTSEMAAAFLRAAGHSVGQSLAIVDLIADGLSIGIDLTPTDLDRPFVEALIDGVAACVYCQIRPGQPGDSLCVECGVASVGGES